MRKEARLGWNEKMYKKYYFSSTMYSRKCIQIHVESSIVLLTIPSNGLPVNCAYTYKLSTVHVYALYVQRSGYVHIDHCSLNHDFTVQVKSITCGSTYKL